MSSRDTDIGTDLAVRRSSTWVLLIVALLLAGTAGLAAWHAHHPEALPTVARTVSANTPVDEPVYIGMATGVPGRSLTLSGVKVHTTSNTDVSVTPLLCRSGRIEATTDPAAFCSDLIDPEGETLEPDDSIILQVLSDVPAVAVIDRVRVGFREGFQWGTLPIGAEAVVRVLAR
ncbi:hypothetical protein BH09ACT12_BH09ACT12_25110 [soil metagenome]